MQITFSPTYLYVKTHNVTGLKYFGKTVKKDPHKYKGSGKRWTNHILKHGYDVTTEIVGYYTGKEECITAAKLFSTEHNIVASDLWANLCEEDGLGSGGARIQTAESKLKRSKSLKGRISPKKGKTSPNKGRVISDEKRLNMGSKNRICRLSDQKEMSVSCFTRYNK